MSSEASEEAATRARVQGLITGAWSTQVIHTAVRLNAFDRLLHGPRAAADLAAETQSHPGAFLRLMRALASIDLVRHLTGDRFELTAAGRLLAAGAPGSIRGMALHWGERLWGALSQLDQSVRTGQPWRASGADGFELMSRDPGQMAMFHQSMTDQTGPVARAMLDAYDFSRFKRIVDVGGSYGALLAAILKAHPDLTGQVFDLPDLAPASTGYLAGVGVADRAAFIGGSFFDGVPAGADAYLLKMIIHDWYDDRAVPILANCAQAAGANGVVLVMERIAPVLVSDGPVDYVTTRGDILMLTAAGGQERTEQHYRDLLATAGLQVTQIVPTASGFAIIEARTP